MENEHEMNSSNSMVSREEQFWFIDLQENLQGPFSETDMVNWHTYFDPQSTLCFTGTRPPFGENRAAFVPYGTLFPESRNEELQQKGPARLPTLPAAEDVLQESRYPADSSMSNKDASSPGSQSKVLYHCFYLDKSGEVQGPFSEEMMQMWAGWFSSDTYCFCCPADSAFSETLPAPDQFQRIGSVFDWAISSSMSRQTATSFSEVKMDAPKDMLRVPDEGETEDNYNKNKILPPEESRRDMGQSLNSGDFLKGPHGSTEDNKESATRRRRRKYRSHLRLVKILTSAKKQNLRGAHLEKNVIRTIECDMRALRLARARNNELDKEMKRYGLPTGSSKESSPLRSTEIVAFRGKNSRPTTILQLPENFAAQELRSNVSGGQFKHNNDDKSNKLDYEIVLSTKNAQLVQCQIDRLRMRRSR